MNREVVETMSPCSEMPPLSFEVTNITGTRSLIANDVDPSLPTEAVAKSLSAELSLPQNLCWALRNDDSAEFLDGAKEIGSQIETGAHVTLTPRAHLG